MIQYEREFDRRRGWDEQARFETRRYVEGRRFRVRTCDEAGMAGERGDLLGNLTSFDMRRLQAYVQVSPVGATRIRVALAVNPRFQQITAWNGAFFRLELVEIQSVLQGGGRLSDAWAAFVPADRWASVSWLLTASIAGRRLPPDWAAYMDQLEAIQVFAPAG